MRNVRLGFVEKIQGIMLLNMLENFIKSSNFCIEIVHQHHCDSQYHGYFKCDNKWGCFSGFCKKKKLNLTMGRGKTFSMKSPEKVRDPELL